MADNELSRAHPPRLYRRTDNGVLGGVCAGIAEYFGLDATLVRVVTVVLALITGGGAALAYLLAWILLPPSPVGVAPPRPTAAKAGVEAEGVEAEETGARAAWSAAGAELRGLASCLRRTATPSGPSSDPTDTEDSRTRSTVESINAAMTSLGDRLRDPQVQADARRAAARVGDAMNASIEEVARRTRRERPADGDTTTNTP